MSLDRRLHAWRNDLADARLRGQVEAARFVEGLPAQVSAAVCPFRAAPDDAAETLAEKLLGEPLLIFETAGDWVWAQSEQDGYVGYARRDRIEAARAPADLRVTALRTHLYPAPSLKTPPLGWAPLGALLASGAGAEEARFRPLASGAWVYAAHVAEPGRAPAWAEDWIAVAEAFAHTPYLWGGESVDGIDCSGLVHVALEAFGQAAPRDSDLQAKGLGEPLADDAMLQRGDLIFWKGHVGVMRDSERLLHANAWSMSTLSEPLADAAARIEAQGGGAITARRRLARL